MNERDALLATIRANPDDDVPRLVYADWLQENGEEARAEFIRVHVRLASEGVDAPCDYPTAGDAMPKYRVPGMQGGQWDGHMPDRNAPQEPGSAGRCGQLLLTVGGEWGQRFARDVGIGEGGGCSWCGMDNAVRFRWRRGFIEEIEIPWRYFERSLSLLFFQRDVVARRMTLAGAAPPEANWTVTESQPERVIYFDGVFRFHGVERRVQHVVSQREFAFEPHEAHRNATAACERLWQEFQMDLPAVLSAAYPGNCGEPPGSQPIRWTIG